MSGKPSRGFIKNLGVCPGESCPRKGLIVSLANGAAEMGLYFVDSHFSCSDPNHTDVFYLLRTDAQAVVRQFIRIQ